MGYKAFHDYQDTHPKTGEGAISKSLQHTGALVAALDVSALVVSHLCGVQLAFESSRTVTPHGIARELLVNASDLLPVKGACRAALVAVCDRAPKPGIKFRTHPRAPEWPEGFDPVRFPDDVPIEPGPSTTIEGVLQQPGEDESLREWALDPSMNWPDEILELPDLWTLALRAPVVRNLLIRAVMVAIYRILVDSDDELAHVFHTAIVVLPDVRKWEGPTTPPGSPPGSPAPTGSVAKKAHPCKREKRDEPHPADGVGEVVAETLRYMTTAGPVLLQTMPGETTQIPDSGTIGKAGPDHDPVMLERLYRLNREAMRPMLGRGKRAAERFCIVDDYLFRGEGDVAGPRLAHLAHQLVLPGQRATVVIQTTDSDAVISSILQAATLGDVWRADRFVQMRGAGNRWTTRQIVVGNRVTACAAVHAMTMLGTDYTHKSQCKFTKFKKNNVFVKKAVEWTAAHPTRAVVVPGIHAGTGMPTVVYRGEHGDSLLLECSTAGRTANGENNTFAVSGEQHLRHAHAVMEYYGMVPSVALGVRVVGGGEESV